MSVMSTMTSQNKVTSQGLSVNSLRSCNLVFVSIHRKDSVSNALFSSQSRNHKLNKKVIKHLIPVSCLDQCILPRR